MKKLFISVPMKGRTDEAIRKSITCMKQVAELMFGEELEVLDSYKEAAQIGSARISIWYLGESIELLSQTDYFIGVCNNIGYKGCRIESEIANSYDIPSKHIDINDFACFDDINVNKLVHNIPQKTDTNSI